MRRLFDIGIRCGVLSIGLALAGVGSVHFLAAVEDLPGNRTIRSIHDGRAVSNEVIEAALASRKDAQDWIDDPKRDLDIAVLLLERAKTGPRDDPEIQNTLAAANTRLLAALHGLPVDAYAWTSLTIAETSLSSPKERLDSLFEMSVLSAPVEERLAAWRLSFGLLNRHWLSEQNQHLLRRQTRIFAKINPDTLVVIATQLKMNAEIAAYLTSVGDFEDVVAKLVPPK